MIAFTPNVILLYNSLYNANTVPDNIKNRSLVDSNIKDRLDNDLHNPNQIIII